MSMMLLEMSDAFLCIYVTGFAKRGLPHTSNSVNMGDHNVVLKQHISLKFSLSMQPC